MSESKIQNDQYGLLEDFTGFTKKYFNTPDTPDNTKLGLFGYMNEIVAHSTKVSMYHRNALYNEISLNTASLPSTIYSAAIDEGVDIVEATPAKATVLFTINSDDLSDAIDEAPEGLLKIDRETLEIDMDDVPFRLPFSIYIRKIKNGIVPFYASTDFAHNGKITKAEPVLVPGTEVYKNAAFIQSVILPIEESPDGKNYIQMQVDVFQYEISSEEHDLVSAYLTNTISFQVDLTDQLAGFTVMYSEPTENGEKTEYEEIDKYQSRSTVLSEDPYCLYNFIDENSYQLLFDLTTDGWKPTSGSTVMIKSCTCIGSEGNFKFTGEMSIKSDLPFEIEGLINISPMNGKDRPTLQELKQMVMNKRMKTEVLSTEEDLNNYFLNIASSNITGISKVIFKKGIDNFISRKFIGYLMMGDSNGRPFPSNTASMLHVPKTKTVIYSGDGICPVLDSSDKEELLEYEIIDKPAEIASRISDENSNKHVYFSPFTIQWLGNNTWKFFDTSSNNLLVPLFTVINTDSESNPVIKYLKVRRRLNAGAFNQAIEEDSFVRNNTGMDDHLSLELVANYDNSANIAFLVILNCEKGSLGIMFESVSDDTTSDKDFFCRMKASTQVFEETNDVPYIEVTHSCNKSVINKEFHLFNMKTGNELDEESSSEVEPTEVVNLSSTVRSKIYVLEKFDTYESTSFGNLTEYDDLEKVIENSSLEYFDPLKYRVKAIAESNEDITIFRDLSNIFNITWTDSEDEYILSNVPIVGAAVQYNDAYYEEFIKNYDDGINIIKDSLNKLVNNTELTIKLFNTYGRTNSWKVQTGMDPADSDPVLNQNDIFLTLDIEREGGQDDEVEASAKQIVEDFFKDLNNLRDNDMLIRNKISLSKLTTAIEKAIPTISACNIVSINNIENPRFLVLDKEAAENTIPEYVSVGLKVDTSENENKAEIPNSLRIKFQYTT